MRYFIKLAYQGTSYNGWQIQKNTPRTIQQVINESFSGLLNEKIELTGCGRTDTGVHAREYYAHFDSTKSDLHINPREWVYKFNVVLPVDIAIQEIIPVQKDAHARFNALSRSYEYIINKKRDPFQLNRAYYIYFPLRIDLMNKAASILFEHEDFSCFSKSNTQVKTNFCKILEASWIENEELFIFTISANRFLRNMVRSIVGTMIEVGKEKISLDDFGKIIENKNRSKAGVSVPAGGLYLTKVKYITGIIPEQ